MRGPSVRLLPSASASSCPGKAHPVSAPYSPTMPPTVHEPAVRQSFDKQHALPYAKHMRCYNGGCINRSSANCTSHHTQTGCFE